MFWLQNQIVCFTKLVALLVFWLLAETKKKMGSVQVSAGQLIAITAQ